MAGINKKYKIKAEVLTPLSVGAGAEKDWAKNVDYVIVDEKLYKLNLNKLINHGLSPDELASLFALKNGKGLVAKLGTHLESVSDFIIPIKVQSENDIKAFVRNQLSGRPIIPGSSLKGAIRSKIFKYLCENSKDENKVFGNIKDGANFMRFIKVSDFEFEETCLVNTKIYNLSMQNNEWQGCWKNAANGNNSTDYRTEGFNTIYECLKPNATAYGNILISDVVFNSYCAHMPNMSYLIKKQHIINDNLMHTLLGIINDYTFDYLGKEWDFFHQYSQGQYATNIKNSISEVMDAINELDDNSCILKMSAGSGFHSITGDWQYDDFANENEAENIYFDMKRGGKLPKSRRIANHNGHFSLMGLIKLTVIDE